MSSRTRAALLVAIGLSGCASTPTPTASTQDVPRDRVLRPALLERRDGLGRLVVKRDEGLIAYPCNTRIFADGEPVAEISAGEKVVMYLPDGDHMLGAISTGICIGGLIEAKVTVSRGRPVVYRISYGSVGEFTMQPTAF